MCGRYTLTMDKSTIKKHLGVKFYIAADLRLVADV
jgi:putative SOS response-associated peptidase YedK